MPGGSRLDVATWTLMLDLADHASGILALLAVIGGVFGIRAWRRRRVARRRMSGSG